MIEPGYEKLSARRPAMLLGIDATGWPCVPTRRGPLWEEELKAPRELDRWHKGNNFSVSSATCFIQSGKGSAFSRVVDLDPIILFRSGSFGINDFTFVAEIA
jgi:hypothetical protein